MFIFAFSFQKEKESQESSAIPNYYFRRGIGTVCEELIEDKEALREYSIPCWMAFVRFVHLVYKELGQHGQYLKSLALILYSILNTLATPPSIFNFEEVCIHHTAVCSNVTLVNIFVP